MNATTTKVAEKYNKQMPANEMVRVRFEKQVATLFCYISVEVVPLEKLKHVQP